MIDSLCCFFGVRDHHLQAEISRILTLLSTCLCLMYSTRATLLFCGIFVQRLPCVVCGDLTSVDYIAIGVSLALAVFILTFLILFYCLAQRRIVTIGRNRREKGREYLTSNCYRIEKMGTIQMLPLASTSQEQNKKPIFNYLTSC